RPSSQSRYRKQPLTNTSTNKHTATTAIYTLSLHDALPILQKNPALDAQNADSVNPPPTDAGGVPTFKYPFSIAHKRVHEGGWSRDRKSTRLNSSHLGISYAVFCLKKKKLQVTTYRIVTAPL